MNERFYSHYFEQEQSFIFAISEKASESSHKSKNPPFPFFLKFIIKAIL
jgi:hypothetical protein